MDAKSRWRLLSRALLSSKDDRSKEGCNNELEEILRFPTFNLLKINKQDNECSGSVTINSPFHPSLNLLVCVVSEALELNHVVGFNNTGNVCVWPSEVCMTHYLLSNQHLLKDKRVIEIGGGMTSLAALASAQSGQPLLTHVTDGHDSSVVNLQKIIRLNGLESNAQAFRLRWDALEKHHLHAYDILLCSDCLFFDSSRSTLCTCIHDLLRPEGMAIVFAPKRGSTLDQFISLCTDKFKSVTMTYDWDEHVSALRDEELKLDSDYVENVHYPILVTLRK